MENHLYCVVVLRGNDEQADGSRSECDVLSLSQIKKSTDLGGLLMGVQD